MSAQSSPPLEVLKNKAFRNLWIAQLCSQTANNTLLFIMALRIYQITSSNTAVSILFLVYGIPAIILGLTAGAIVDKINSRTVLIVCDLVRAILALSFLVLPHYVAFIYILALVNAVITQFYVPAEAPSIPRLVSRDQIMTANSFFSFTFYSSLALGSVLAGPLMRLFGPLYVFGFIGVLFGLAYIFAQSLPTAPFEAKYRIKNLIKRSLGTIVPRVWTDVREGVIYVTGNKQLFDALSLLLGTQIIFAILGVLGPGFADKILHIDIRDASIYIVGPAVLGIVAGALWVGNLGYTMAPRLLIRIGVFSVGILLLVTAVLIQLISSNIIVTNPSQSGVLYALFGLFFLIGFANAFLDVPANSLLQEEAHGQMRGRVYGILASAVGGVGVLPVIAGGVIADFTGIGTVVSVLGILVMVYGIIRLRKEMGFI